ncbi:hypothetical protein C1645_840926 [Glomus cerebriforme]|uniref:Uncharacterized protein n=1 Tax=Glomus cerebriforme TaxID=658196 RepID=A0A397S3F1_9GLOM|nr:hypothetical protein C1645_840926 [Glomus cerebriforme]
MSQTNPVLNGSLRRLKHLKFTSFVWDMIVSYDSSDDSDDDYKPYKPKNGINRFEQEISKYESPNKVSTEINYKESKKCAIDGLAVKTETEINLKPSFQVYDFTSFGSKGSSGINSSGCSGEFDNFEMKGEIYSKSSIQKNNVTSFQNEASIGGEIGIDGGKINAKIGTTLYSERNHDKDADSEFLKVEASKKVGLDGEVDVNLGSKATLYREQMFKAGVDLIDYDDGNLKANIGFNVDTGFSINKEGVEAKVEGFGVKLGKEMGISTPYGGLSYNIIKDIQCELSDSKNLISQYKQTISKLNYENEHLTRKIELEYEELLDKTIVGETVKLRELHKLNNGLVDLKKINEELQTVINDKETKSGEQKIVAEKKKIWNNNIAIIKYDKKSQLVGQNSTLKKEVAIVERKVLIRNERIQILEALLQDSQESLSTQNQKFKAQLQAVQKCLG